MGNTGRRVPLFATDEDGTKAPIGEAAINEDGSVSLEIDQSEVGLQVAAAIRDKTFKGMSVRAARPE